MSNTLKYSFCTPPTPEGESTARIIRLCALLFLCAFAPLRDLKAQYTIERADSLTTRLCQTTWAPDGSVSKSCSHPYGGDTTRTMLINIAHQKRQYIDAQPWVMEWALIDSSLVRYTGKAYDAIVNDQIAAAITGDWHISHGSDTMDIKVSRDLKVTGGKIKGAVIIKDPNTIRLAGVLPDPIDLSVDPKSGRLGGEVKGVKVVMWRG